MREEVRELVVNVRQATPEVYVGRRSGRWEGSKWGNPFPLHGRTTRHEVVLRVCAVVERAARAARRDGRAGGQEAGVLVCAQAVPRACAGERGSSERSRRRTGADRQAAGGVVGGSWGVRSAVPKEGGGRRAGESMYCAKSAIKNSVHDGCPPWTNRGAYFAQDPASVTDVDTPRASDHI